MAHGEIGKYQYGARGAVKTSAEIKIIEGEKIFEVNLQLAENWHINAHQSNSSQADSLQSGLDDIEPTSLYIDAATHITWQLDNVSYPQSVNRQFSFRETPLQVYEGEFTLRGSLSSKNKYHKNMLVPVILQFQACNDQVCLAPEELTLRASL